MSPADRLWAFSTALYAAPGVEAACLDLQERFGADVNLALFCVWAGPLDAAGLARAAAAAAPVQRDLVLPLRAMRRALARGGEEAPLRAAVKAAELEAERLELARLAAAAPPAPERAARTAARGNLALYAASLGADPATFLAAAAPLLSRSEGP
jgi:uncharacterized protein (TIGR02444 family)